MICCYFFKLHSIVLAARWQGRNKNETLLGQRTTTQELLGVGGREKGRKKRSLKFAGPLLVLFNFEMGRKETKCRSLGKSNCLSVGSDLEDIFIYFHIKCSINQSWVNMNWWQNRKTLLLSVCPQEVPGFLLFEGLASLRVTFWKGQS